MADTTDNLALTIGQWPPTLLTGRCIGIEKETLRMGADGAIAKTPHPPTLGSALSHPHITTDFSEALLELITPPLSPPEAVLDCLANIHGFVYRRMSPEELLWSASMPCVMDGEEAIPIAYYGTSHQGRMKHIYRRGLGYRYGKRMQIIAGIHFNFSLPEAFWLEFREFTDDRRTLQAVVSDGYFRLIRNQQRLGWLLLYLFGCSPAVCKSFLRDRPDHTLQEFDATTLYAPHATSLRMSDLGYTNKNKARAEAEVSISYNSLEDYIAGLRTATGTPYPDYQRIGVQVNGEYRQLNGNILQIENEFYGTIRPKQGLEPNEKPTHALDRRGVSYVELRSLDVDMLEPTGIGPGQLRFLESFLLYCLLQPSPPIDQAETTEIQDNLLATAVRGREPGLRLHRDGREISLQQWGRETLAGMEAVCELLDGEEPGAPYRAALAAQRACVEEPALTPSARTLAGMREAGEGFFHFAKRQSLAHREYFLGLPRDNHWASLLAAEVEHSRERQQALEAASRESSFEAFLADYLAQ